MFDMLAAAFTLALGAASPGGAPDETVIFSDTVVRACYRAAQRGEASPEAISVCTEAIELSARHPFNRTASTVNRGVLLFNAADYDGALEDFTTAIEDYGTKNPKVFVNRGLAYEAARPGHPPYEVRARADYERALESAPGNKIARRRLKALERPFIERRPLNIRTIT